MQQLYILQLKWNFIIPKVIWNTILFDTCILVPSMFYYRPYILASVDTQVESRDLVEPSMILVTSVKIWDFKRNNPNSCKLIYVFIFVWCGIIFFNNEVIIKIMSHFDMVILEMANDSLLKGYIIAFAVTWYSVHSNHHFGKMAISAAWELAPILFNAYILVTSNFCTSTLYFCLSADFPCIFGDIHFRLWIC